MNDGTSQLATPVEANAQADSQGCFHSATSFKGKRGKASSVDAIERQLKSIRDEIKQVARPIREGNLSAERGRPHVYSEQEVFSELVKIGIERQLKSIRDGIKQVARAIREGNLIAERGRPLVYSEQEVFSESVKIGIERQLKSIRDGIKQVARAIREGNLIAERGRPHVYSEQEVFTELVKIGVETHLRYKAYKSKMYSPDDSSILD